MHNVDSNASSSVGGFVRAYQYRDFRTGLYDVALNEKEAMVKADGEVTPLLVHYADGCFDRIIEDKSNGLFASRLMSAMSDSQELGDREGDDEKQPEEVKAPSASRGSARNGEDSEEKRRRQSYNQKRAKFRAEWLDECDADDDRRLNMSDNPEPSKPENGFGYAYRYFDLRTGRYEITEDEFASRIAGLDRQKVWAVYREGAIDHLASHEEYQGELELRVGSRIRSIVPEDEFLQFAYLEDDAEITNWFNVHCPNLEAIVADAIAEMETAIVVDGF